MAGGAALAPLAMGALTSSGGATSGTTQDASANPFTSLGSGKNPQTPGQQAMGQAGGAAQQGQGLNTNQAADSTGQQTNTDDLLQQILADLGLGGSSAFAGQDGGSQFGPGSGTGTGGGRGFGGGGGHRPQFTGAGRGGMGIGRRFG